MSVWINTIVYVIVILCAFFMGRRVGRIEGEKRVLDQIALIDKVNKKHRVNQN